ncbi:MAG: hypothetical protein J6Y16_06400, partial [Treponema sp.]|nr:hypothetical protein [Treponema sp.]
TISSLIVPCSPKEKICTNQGLGFGKINTYKIITAQYDGYIVYPKNCLASACYEYTTPTTKKGDWFLPSLEELIYLFDYFCCEHQYNVSDTNFASSSFYWASHYSNYYKKIEYDLRNLHVYLPNPNNTSTKSTELKRGEFLDISLVSTFWNNSYTSFPVHAF